MNAVIVSRSGMGHGWGSDRWKWVSGLTAAERAAVRAGDIVLITGCPMAGGNHGTTVRQVVMVGKGFDHRVPAAVILIAVGEQDPRPSA
jgi:hypothetical protein